MNPRSARPVAQIRRASALALAWLSLAGALAQQPAQVWSSCSAPAPINIKTAIQIDNSRNRSAPGQTTTDSTDVRITHICGIVWRSC